MELFIFSVGAFVFLLVAGGLYLTVSEFGRIEQRGPQFGGKFPL